MSGESTLLKITDFPFSYSVTFILLAFFEYDLTLNSIPILILAGLGATFLTVVNPIGFLIQRYWWNKINFVISYDEKTNSYKSIKDEPQFGVDFHENIKHNDKLIQDLKDKNKQTIEISDIQRKNAITTKVINFERDKLVSIIYFTFVISLFLFLFSIEFFVEYDNDYDYWGLTNTFENYLLIINSSKTCVEFNSTAVICNIATLSEEPWISFNNFLIIQIFVLLIAITFLLLTYFKFENLFKKRASTIALLLYFIDNGAHDPRKTKLIDRMDNYIEHGSWQMAEVYRYKLVNYLIDPTNNEHK